jgi:hypothetical protein
MPTGPATGLTTCALKGANRQGRSQAPTHRKRNRGNGCFDGSITLECDEVLEDSHHAIKQSCKDSAHFAEDSIGADLARYNSDKDRGSNQEVDGGLRRKPANIDQNRRRAVWKSGVSCYNCLLSIDNQQDLQSIDLNITQCSGIDALVSVGALFQEKSQCLSIQFCN